MKNALAVVLGAAGSEFAATICDLLYSLFGISVHPVAKVLIGLALGILMTVVFVILPEVKKNV